MSSGLPSAAYGVDIEARALRERLEFAVLGDDDRSCAAAARALVAFVAAHPEYRLCALVPFDGRSGGEKDAVARQITSKFSGRCSGCSGDVAAGDLVWWTPGTKGVRCSRCGGAE